MYNLNLKKDVTVVTSLYHSPFDLNLLYLILLGKTGIHVNIILDDIDSLGLNKSKPRDVYTVDTKFQYSKTARSNLRPLTFLLPNHLFGDLTKSNFKALDETLSLVKLKQIFGESLNLESMIQKFTTVFGQSSIVGPDKAFGFCEVDQEFINSIQKQTQKVLDLIVENNFCDNKVFERHKKIFAIRPLKGELIVSYYLKFLENIIEIFDLPNITISKMTSFGKKNINLYNDFLSNPNFRDVYQEALVIDGNKSEGDLPFYLIDEKDGNRMLVVTNECTESDSYFLSPKVLMLNNFINLVLPFDAHSKQNVQAREVMYKSGLVNCSQIFLNDNWLNYLEKFDIKIGHYSAEFFDKKFCKKLAINEENLAVLTTSEKDNLRNWFIDSTKSSIAHLKYPILFLVIFGDDIFCRNPESLDFYELG